MLLIVDDRFVDPRLTKIKEHLLGNVLGEMLNSMVSVPDLKIISFTGSGPKIVWKRGDESSDGLSEDRSVDLLDILDADEDNDCILMNRIAFFSEGFKECLRYHDEGENDVTVLVKELPAMPGMYGVSVDQDSNISYRKREDPVRGKSLDLNMYILKKDLIVDLIHDDIEINGLEVRSLPLHHEVLRMKGYRIRSKVGFTDDLVSLLETQRMAMDAYLSNIEKETSRNIMIPSDLILNMPVFATGAPVIGSKCRIGPYTSVLKDARIGDNVFIINSIISEKCVIEDDSYIEGSVLGPGLKVEKGSEIEWVIKGQ